MVYIPLEWLKDKENLQKVHEILDKLNFDAIKELEEINEVTRYNYVVVNDEVENAVKKVEAILIAEKCSVSRIDDLELDNKEELIHDLFINSNNWLYVNNMLNYRYWKEGFEWILIKKYKRILKTNDTI